MKKIILTLFITLSMPVFAASFDCAKASTSHEKLICANPALSDADTQLGDAYKATNKSFPISGFIQDNQRAWLSSYRSCKDMSTCLELVNLRIQKLNKLKNSNVYTDYVGNKLDFNGGTIIIFDDGPNKIATFFGNWMPDGHIDPNKMKGYPKDGFICDDDVLLTKKGNSFVPKDPNGLSDLSLLIDSSKLVLKGSIPCGRAGFASGTFKKNN